MINTKHPIHTFGSILFRIMDNIAFKTYDILIIECIWNGWSNIQWQYVGKIAQ